jgi:electron transfer flavoprotein alpha subunit
VVGVCAAASDPGLAALGAAGAEQVLLATHESFARYEPAGYAAAIVAAVEQVKPAVVLLAASSMGRDLAPRVAARLQVGLAAECTALAVEGGVLTATRPIYAAKAIQQVRFAKTPALATLRPKAFAPIAGSGTATVTPLAVTLDASPRARVTDLTASGGGKVDLTEAEIIVSGGRGLKGPEHLAAWSAPRARWWMRAGGRTATRSDRPARP